MRAPPSGGAFAPAQQNPISGVRPNRDLSCGGLHAPPRHRRASCRRHRREGPAPDTPPPPPPADTGEQIKDGAVKVGTAVKEGAVKVGETVKQGAIDLWESGKAAVSSGSTTFNK